MTYEYKLPTFLQYSCAAFSVRALIFPPQCFYFVLPAFVLNGEKLRKFFDSLRSIRLPFITDKTADAFRNACSFRGLVYTHVNYCQTVRTYDEHVASKSRGRVRNLANPAAVNRADRIPNRKNLVGNFLIFFFFSVLARRTAIIVPPFVQLHGYKRIIIVVVVLYLPRVARVSTTHNCGV